MLTPSDPPFAKSPAGAGPRHLTFHPDGKQVYVINELLNSVTVFDYDARSGTLSEKQTVSTLPDDFKGVSHCADVKVTPDGRYLYGTNRGHDSIAAYRVGEDGRLSARLKLSYDVRFTNRLILAPNLEANAYSESEDERNLGAGLGNLEWGLRVRYEVHRKFAPYAGYVWERSFSGTADRRRAEGEPVNEHRFVAGFRMWF